MERSRSSRVGPAISRVAGIRYQLGVRHLDGVGKVGAAKVLEELTADLPERLDEAAARTS